MKNLLDIKNIFVDCDGVLSTGSFFYTSEGKTFKEFSSMDGKGFHKAKINNISILVITEEPDDKGFNISKSRCNDQRINIIRAKDSYDKLTIAKEFCQKNGFSLDNCAFIADDIGDWDLFTNVSLPIAVKNAHESLIDYVLENSGYVTKRLGGRGAVREAIEWVIEKSATMKPT